VRDSLSGWIMWRFSHDLPLSVTSGTITTLGHGRVGEPLGRPSTADAGTEADVR
jgi:hypothetical protein